MFTGIVTHLGTVERIGSITDGVELEIVPGFALADLSLGASVAHSGICLTVAERRERSYIVQATGETVARTTVGDWRPGRAVNLERSLKLGDELGGHLVFGHVDGIARLDRVQELGGSRRLAFTAPAELAPMLAVKGSVALDGISLTVTGVGSDGFAVVIIPHTLTETTLKHARPGDRFNVEVDMLARYVARQLGELRR